MNDQTELDPMSVPEAGCPHGIGHNSRATPQTEIVTMSVPEAGRRLGVGRNSAYEAAARGEIPTIKIGRRLLVPRVAFERMLERAGEPEAVA